MTIFEYVLKNQFLTQGGKNEVSSISSSGHHDSRCCCNIVFYRSYDTERNRKRVVQSLTKNFNHKGVKMKNITRELGQLTFASAGNDSIILPHDYAYVDLILELQASITYTAGTTAGTLLDLAPAQLVKSIDFRVNGRDSIKGNIDFEGLAKLTNLRYGTAGNNTILANSAGTQACYIYAIMPFAMWRSIRPFDTVLNVQQATTVEFLVSWGTIGSCFANYGTYDATYTVNSAKLVIGSRESVGLAKETVLPINKESVREYTVTATSANTQIDLNYAKDLYYRAIVLKAQNNGSTSNSIINSIQLKSGGVVFYNLSGVMTRARNKFQYAVETMPTGWYAIDFAEDGRVLADSLDTSMLSSLSLVLDVTKGSSGTDKIRVYTTELVVPTVTK